MAKVTKEILYDLYVTQGLTCRECSEVLGMKTHGGVSWALKKFGIPARVGRFQVGNKVEHASGDKHPGWKGGKKTVLCATCGKEISLFPVNVKDANFCSRECQGKSRRKDMAGKKIGMLSVVRQFGKDKYEKLLWECLCDCGETKSYTASDLAIVKSCGCMLHGTGEDSSNWKGGKIKVKCSNPGCNKTKMIHPSQKYDNSYCSNKCRIEHCAWARSGKDNYNYLGGHCQYDTYAGQLGFAEKVRRSAEDERVLEVKCVHCRSWFKPNAKQVTARIRVLYDQKGAVGSGYFYCSDDCKASCSVFRKIKYPKGHLPVSVRCEAVDPQTRLMVLERDDYQCSKCDSQEDLHVHHIEGVAQVPMLANDISNCMTVCSACHAEIHKQPGCSYQDYRRDTCENIAREAV